MTKKIENMLALVTVRRDGRVLFCGLRIGAVKRQETHDGPAWFWSRDGFEDECEGGAPTRRDAVGDMLETMSREAR